MICVSHHHTVLPRHQAKQHYAADEQTLSQLSFPFEQNTLHDDITCGQLADHLGYHRDEGVESTDWEPQLFVDEH